ncbi:MAG: chromosome segregation protein SMC [Bdellovibrionota bacterium]
MFLKKIINNGFKSFADRITITLDKNHITGIVGPNGSGKSNVIDSVRWVMGEQNAKMLRGEKATDIIFAGSEKRKPLGMAEVTLVFDNSEGSSFCTPEYRHETEITLTRRLYIDGQREYLINKKPCRLKDIVSFFTSTGLGGRSYSMIQQGQVDRILQAKPEEIREILEEAAGTLVFKKRKHEALKKLEATRLNLSRIEDILHEVERQKGALHEQVEKARKFKSLAEELKVKEIELLSHNFTAFSEKLKAIESELTKLSDREIQLVTQINDFEIKQSELQDQLNEADPEVQALNEAITVLREKIARSEASLINANHLLENGDERLSQLDGEITEEGDALKELEQRVEEKTLELSKADEQAQQLKDQLETFQYEMEMAAEEAQVFSNKIDEFEDELKNLDRLIESNKLRQESIERDFSNSERNKNKIKDQLINAESELSQTLILVDSAQVKVSNKRKGLDAELNEKNSRENAITQRNQKIKDLSHKRDILKEEYLNTRAKLTSLQDLEASSSDLASQRQKIKEEESDLSQIMLGVLTDYISFNETAEELSEKASGAFEKWAERIIVNGLDQFNNLVRIAHSKNIGGMPVSVLSSQELPEQKAIQEWAEKFDAQPFSHFLTVDPSLEGLAQFVNRIFHLPILVLENEVLEELPRGAIVITAQGVVFSGQDEFIVGNQKGKGALKRKTEIEDLAKNLKELESKLAASQSEIDTLDASQTEDRIIIQEIDQKLQNQNQEVLQLMSDLQSAKQQANSKQELIGTLREEYGQLEETTDKFANELESLRKNLNSYQTERNQTEVELEDTKEQSQSLIDRKEELTTLTEQRRIELAKGEARAQALRENHNSFAGQLESMQTKLTRKYQEKNELIEKIKKAKDESVRLEKDIETFILTREEKENLLAEKREENSGIIEELRVIENRLRELRSEQQKSQKVTSDKNVEIERLKLGIESTTEQAQTKYHINLEEYEFEKIDNFKADGRQREVNKLRDKIDAMGPINVMAIDEYEELVKREDFINSQKDEVISSVDLLETAIEEIETNSTTKFIQTFETLNIEFQGLFPILFPGGEAQIVMTNPEDPLEGGVEILVRLPGKKQQNMRLFSGGEKALTAIALIFALLKSKPTPFCFLDEVDAPLDETNVGRYNRVLEALSDRFQFIVITHNRRTMEVLDTLFGVTMQEPGVSKVVGVDMTKDLPSHLKKAFKDTPKPLPVNTQQIGHAATVQ